MRKKKSSVKRVKVEPVWHSTSAPQGASEEAWDLFLACGQAVLVLLGQTRSKRPDEGQILLLSLLSDDLDLLERRALSQNGGADRSPRVHRSPKPSSRRSFPSKDPTENERDDVTRAAFQLLTEGAMETFPFLRNSPPEMPAIAVVCAAAACAQYVLRGESKPITDLRRLFSLFEPRPHGWEGLGRPLSSYCNKKLALLDFEIPQGQLSGLDGAVTLSKVGFKRLLGIANPPECSDEDEYVPAFFRRIQGRRLSTRARRQAREKRPDPKIIQLSRPRLTLDQVVLAQPLKEDLLLVQALYRRKKPMVQSMLFYGSPGTGKTHAARAIAGSIKRPLATVALGNLFDKYVGETEKHLEEAFREAERAKAVLLFDEADALLHTRENAQRTYEIAWVNTLLKLLERPAIPVILSTNFLPKLDAAVHRRIHHIIEFPMPGPEERIEIWGLELGKARIKTAVDLEQLAAIPLTGGLIANAVGMVRRKKVLWGRTYRVTTQELCDAARREIPKMGTVRGLAKPIGFRG